MSQTPHPHDPFGNEPSDSVPEHPAASAPSSEDVVSPTSDPALHPYDPYAASAQPAGSSAASAPAAPYASGSSAAEPSAASPYGAPAPLGQPLSADQQGSYAEPNGYAPQDAYQHPGSQSQQGQQGQQDVYGQQQAPQAGPQSTDVPPPGTKGVYDGPLSGQPLNDSDTRMWAMFAQLTVTLGHVVSWGFLGWVGPLIVFLIYKDRNRFVRFHAAEALNGAITVLIAQVVLSIVLGIFAIVTLGIGSPLLALVPVPALIQLIFSIVAAVKANQGQWWSYPVNIRLVK